MRFFGGKVCVIGAHPDDIELGAGALIARLTKQTEVVCVTLSENVANPKLRGLREQHYRSMGVLGVSRENTIVASFQSRRFSQDRQDILQYLFDLAHDRKPDLVLTHSQADIHQDHQVTTGEVLRAFRGTTVLGYEIIRSSDRFCPAFLVEVTEDEVRTKIRALAEYDTYADKYYFKPEIIRAGLIRNGALVERQYAEGFEALRIIASF